MSFHHLGCTLLEVACDENTDGIRVVAQNVIGASAHKHAVALTGSLQNGFSLKLEDTPEGREKVYRAMELAKAYFPRVMVEMPVLPNAEAEMHEILDRLEAMGVFGINLLELCFPYHNAEAFRERGYRLRYPPYRTLYNFWYAGGLPVDGSELLALKLLEYAAEHSFRLNVHYCSLENKHFGQVYMQNLGAAAQDRSFVMSEKDFYLKTVKAFGKDISRAERGQWSHRSLLEGDRSAC